MFARAELVGEGASAWVDFHGQGDSLAARRLSCVRPPVTEALTLPVAAAAAAAEAAAAAVEEGREEVAVEREDAAGDAAAEEEEGQAASRAAGSPCSKH